MDRVGEYVDWRVGRGEFARSTAITASAGLHHWHHCAGPVNEWTPEFATQWVHDQALRPNARKGRLSRLRPYVRWLVRHGHLDFDITIDIPAVKIPHPAPKDLTPAAIRRLIDAAPDRRGRLIVVMMVQCGLRCVDLSRALIEDIDTSSRRLAVRAKGGGGEVTHTVPIPTEAWELLVSEVLAVRRSGPIICAQNRLSPTAVSRGHLSKLVQRWIIAAGLKSFPFDGVGAHALRHTCAQDMLDRGADIRAVQAALGHAHQSTTEIYLRREPPGLRDAMEGRRYAA